MRRLSRLAALLRPLMLARSSQEALFAERAWLWGITCSKAVELISRFQGRDVMAHTMVRLLPTLSYLVVRREIVRI